MLEKCPNKEFFFSLYFSTLGLNMEICNYPYLVQMGENTDQKKNLFLDTFYAVYVSMTVLDLHLL